MITAPAARAKHALGNVLMVLPTRPQTGAYCSVQTVGRRGAGDDCAIRMAPFGSWTGVADKGGAEATNATSAAARAVLMAISPNAISGGRLIKARALLRSDKNFDGRVGFFFG
jgi:hypothetical protein